MKKNYIKPQTEVAETQTINTYLFSGSDGTGNPLLGNGGGSGAGGVTSGDARERGTRNTDSFDDLW